MVYCKLTSKRILVVEDDVLIGFDIADSIGATGAVVIGPCGSLEDAISAAVGHDLDLAILDIDLGGKQVFPAARQLMSRGIPFVFHTGVADRNPLRGEFCRIPVCTKPVSMGRLIAMLEDLLPVAA